MQRFGKILKMWNHVLIYALKCKRLKKLGNFSGKFLARAKKLCEVKKMRQTRPNRLSWETRIAWFRCWSDMKYKTTHRKSP